MTHFILCDACGLKLDFGKDKIYHITMTSNQGRDTFRSRLLCEACYTEFAKYAFDEKGENDENPNS